MKNSLLYMIAFDAVGEIFYRSLAKMAISSLLEAGWLGDVVLFSNGDNTVFVRAHPQVREENISTSGPPAEVAEYARRFKHLASELIPAEKYAHVIYADADTLFTEHFHIPNSSRNALWVSEETWVPMKDGGRSAFFPKKRVTAAAGRFSKDAGFWHVDGAVYPNLMSEWRGIYESQPPSVNIEKRDRQAWNYLLARKAKDIQIIPPHRLLYPLASDAGIRYLNDASVLHFCGVPRQVKFSQMFGTYMQLQPVERAAQLIHLF
jgi:hypothetical protein